MAKRAIIEARKAQAQADLEKRLIALEKQVADLKKANKKPAGEADPKVPKTPAQPPAKETPEAEK